MRYIVSLLPILGMFTPIDPMQAVALKLWKTNRIGVLHKP